jgi:hypothetical protein
LFFRKSGQLSLAEKYAFGVFQLDPVGFEWIFIEPIVLNSVVDDLPKIADVLLGAIVIGTCG